ncbi:acetyltransferase, GNAT family [Fulvivirga imtechensis AK7]|uniref:Acetyltransferase, GNAT family n=2 Tax=Fulvivirga TaxID=396811 RepID=L8JNK4_9BACT|nr:acetyltransferase, GNAT family [Fulvivirga imtechensis AK7]
MAVRLAVKENVLADLSRVSRADCEEYLTRRGRGWVCELQDQIVGFAVVDLQENNVWALFILPEYEGRGIGRKLHHMMLDWYFSRGKSYLWLTTGMNTRAEKFYESCGWLKTGPYGDDEVKFEMRADDWLC